MPKPIRVAAVLFALYGLHVAANATAWQALDQLAQDRVYEFLFIFTPLPVRAATGSPGRPLAIR